MKPWKPTYETRPGKNPVRRVWQLQTSGGHWMLELDVRYFKSVPTKAYLHWYEAHPGEWHQIYHWETNSKFLIISMVLEGRPFMQFVRDSLNANTGGIRQAVAFYSGIQAGSFKAIEVR